MSLERDTKNYYSIIQGDIDSMLDTRIIETIKKFIENKWKQEELYVYFPNRLLREDVLELLDRYCTIIYYPLENESNNGFHTRIPSLKRGVENFVFINTAQTIEKQVFTAAHELGHLWDVDEYVCSENNVVDQETVREDIINRFAAELLMPEDEFLNAALSEIKKNTDDSKSISIGNMLKVTAVLMNMFCVPYRSVIMRFGEVGLLSSDSCAELLGKGKIEKKTIDDIMTAIFEVYGYSRFITASNKKWIEGLPELLNQAEKLDSISRQKIEKLRKEFDLPKESTAKQIDGIVKIKDLSKEAKISNDDN
jgi:Zn-dependent peptidase ImmA (M78 family)